MSEYLPSIGLEIHAELKTRTKMFCDSLNDPDEKHPNVNACPVCMGHPGTLPVANLKAVEHVLKVGMALGSKIPERSKFDRKNYFYPDLPKGYQISQYDEPLCQSGALEIPNSKFQIPNKSQNSNDQNRGKVRIRRVHLEEDTGRLIHPEGKDYSLVDFNRAGVPLMELVTEPDIHSAEEARAFAEELQLLFRYLGVSDADMEKGQMRLEANISLMCTNEDSRIFANKISADSRALGTKVEVKNLNSFRALEEAIRYEIKRQAELLEEGKEITQETRGWDDVKKATLSQRSKEEAQDYRYFPEPDLPPIDTKKLGLERLRVELPELPWEKRKRFAEEYGFTPKDAEILVREPEFAEFFEQAVSELAAHDQYHAIQHKRADLVKLIYNYLISDLKGLMAESDVAIVPSDLRIRPEHLAHLAVLLHQDKISSRVAKNVLEEMFRIGEDPETIVREKGLEQVSDSAVLEKVADSVIQSNPKAVQDYKAGKANAIQFLKGQVMIQMRGTAQVRLVEEILKKKLG